MLVLYAGRCKSWQVGISALASPSSTRFRSSLWWSGPGPVFSLNFLSVLFVKTLPRPVQCQVRQGDVRLHGNSCGLVGVELYGPPGTHIEGIKLYGCLVTKPLLVRVWSGLCWLASRGCLSAGEPPYSQRRGGVKIYPEAAIVVHVPFRKKKKK